MNFSNKYCVSKFKKEILSISILETHLIRHNLIKKYITISIPLIKNELIISERDNIRECHSLIINFMSNMKIK